MIAGKLRHGVYIRQPVEVVTAKRDTEMTYVTPSVNDPIDAYASIEPLVGRELIVARGIRADVSHKIKLRYTTSITQKSRIYWFNGIDMEAYNVGPAVNAENRNIEVNFYGIRIS